MRDTDSSPSGGSTSRAPGHFARKDRLVSSRQLGGEPGADRCTDPERSGLFRSIRAPGDRAQRCRPDCAGEAYPGDGQNLERRSRRRGKYRERPCQPTSVRRRSFRAWWRCSITIRQDLAVSWVASRCSAVSDIPAAVEKHGVKLAILAVPADSAQQVADQLIDAGVRGLLNLRWFRDQ